MVIRRISSSEPKRSLKYECNTPEEQKSFLRWPEVQKINTVEESVLHVHLKRKSKDIIVWSCINLLLIVMVHMDLFSGFINADVERVLNGVIFSVCVCNLLYYLCSFISVTNEENNQKFRLTNHYKSVTTPTLTKKIDFVRYTNYEATGNSLYWNDFHSIFESFKRMTARNSIAFFPNDSHRRSVDVTENITAHVEAQTSGGDMKFMFSETMAKYKGRLITTGRHLRQYLTDHKMAEENEFVKTSEDSNLYNDNTEFWSARRRNQSDNVMDISPLLRRSEYQISPNTSDTSISSIKDLGCTNQEFFSLLRDKYKIESSTFIYWISNFRMWLSKTVLGRIITEINVVDKGFKSLRFSGVTIGSVGLETLEDACRNPTIAHKLPSLSYLLPFLRVSTRQQYIVDRFRTLSQGHGMGDFKWNSGSEIGNKPWERGYPTDAELIMHLFATYLDRQLPLSPSNSDTSKPFSSNYLTESVQAAKQKKVAIIRQSLNPPHYNLLIDNEVQEIPPGRNNLFYTIILFLYCIKEHEHGMLGRFSLGKHGIDLLWIIDDCR